MEGRAAVLSPQKSPLRLFRAIDLARDQEPQCRLVLLQSCRVSLGLARPAALCNY